MLYLLALTMVSTTAMRMPIAAGKTTASLRAIRAPSTATMNSMAVAQIQPAWKPKRHSTLSMDEALHLVTLLPAASVVGVGHVAVQGFRGVKKFLSNFLVVLKVVAEIISSSLPIAASSYKFGLDVAYSDANSKMYDDVVTGI